MIVIREEEEESDTKDDDSDVFWGNRIPSTRDRMIHVPWSIGFQKWHSHEEKRELFEWPIF